MILGYLAYAVVFTAGLLTGCALADHKIQNLKRLITWQDEVIRRVVGVRTPGAPVQDEEDW